MGWWWCVCGVGWGGVVVVVGVVGCVGGVGCVWVGWGGVGWGWGAGAAGAGGGRRRGGEVQGAAQAAQAGGAGQGRCCRGWRRVPRRAAALRSLPRPAQRAHVKVAVMGGTRRRRRRRDHRRHCSEARGGVAVGGLALRGRFRGRRRYLMPGSAGGMRGCGVCHPRRPRAAANWVGPKRENSSSEVQRWWAGGGRRAAAAPLAQAGRARRRVVRLRPPAPPSSAQVRARGANERGAGVPGCFGHACQPVQHPCLSDLRTPLAGAPHGAQLGTRLTRSHRGRSQGQAQQLESALHVVLSGRWAMSWRTGGRAGCGRGTAHGTEVGATQLPSSRALTPCSSRSPAPAPCTTCDSPPGSLLGGVDERIGGTRAKLVLPPAAASSPSSPGCGCIEPLPPRPTQLSAS